ncbi:MAG TPA: sigma-70 family RNA polymerase sigma factor [Chitinophagaceae bacterium]|nr:sigma-70 family RNA polymerase sigma factor [Chitinophagaceae bacterium]
MHPSQINESVVERFSKGDMEAFASIYNQYWERVAVNISKIIFQQEITEDILHNVFFKLWENRHKFRDESSIASWLFRVSYNESVNWIRLILKEKKYISAKLPESVQRHISPEEDMEIDELKEGLLQEAINLLPDRKKQVFELCKLQGKTYSEAGIILGIKPNTVKEYMAGSLAFVKSHVLSKYAASSLITIAVLDAWLQ